MVLWSGDLHKTSGLDIAGIYNCLHYYLDMNP